MGVVETLKTLPNWLTSLSVQNVYDLVYIGGRGYGLLPGPSKFSKELGKLHYSSAHTLKSLETLKQIPPRL